MLFLLFLEISIFDFLLSFVGRFHWDTSDQDWTCQWAGGVLGFSGILRLLISLSVVPSLLLFFFRYFFFAFPLFLHQGVQCGVSAFRLRHLAGPVCTFALRGV